MKLSENLSLAEVIKSRTALKLGIDNRPSKKHLDSLKDIAQDIFQPLRDAYGRPIFVTSGYRSPALNKAIGGSANSQHTLGEALDLDNVVDNVWLFGYILENLDFDQLIWEFGDDKNPDWIHVSYTTRRENRREVLRAVRRNNKVIYEHY